MNDESILDARRVLEVEAQALLDLRERISDEFVEAMELLRRCEGKIIVTGIGKSGQIARKIASTLSSTGSPAVFLHPSESSHGDLGTIGNKDVLLALSYGGESPELTDIVKFSARRGIPMIVMTGKLTSSLSQSAQVVLDVTVKEEACPFGLAPTASSTAMLGLGDALAIALLKKRGFKEEDFAEFHPGGSLGRRLLTQVKDVMHKADAVPLFRENDNLKSILTAMAGPEVRGVVGIIDAQENLAGCITDGDIRRHLSRQETLWNDSAGDLMARNPKTIDMRELAVKASFVMEQFSIQVLFVIDKQALNPRKPIGVITFQDLFRARIR